MLNHQKRTIKENRMSVEEVQLCLQEVNESIESQKEVDKVLGLGAVWNTAKVEPGSIVAVFGFGTIGLAVFNFSTGRIINKTIFDSEVTSMDHDHTGQLIFCGDGQGCIYTVKMNSRCQNERKSLVTTVQYRTFSLLA